MNPHTLPSYRNYQEANDYLLQLYSAGLSDEEITNYEQEVNRLRRIYEQERQALEVAAAPMPTATIAPTAGSFCNVMMRPERSLRDIAPLVAAGSDEMFVFDFDDTLASRFEIVWANGLRRYDPRHQPDEYIAMPGFSDIVTALRNTNSYFLILTARNPAGITEVQQYLSQFGVPVYVMGTRREDGTEIPKGNYMLELIKSNPTCSKWNFIDDTIEHVESVRSVISSQCPRSLTLRLFHVYGYSEFRHGVDPGLQAQYQEEYFSSM